MRPWILIAATTLSITACSTTPTITSTNTTLTPAQIAEMGLICRKDNPPDTNIPRTICASEESWAAFDERRRKETAELMAEGRKYANVGRFNRD